MNTYPQLTPALKARGRYKLRKPFAVADNIDYTCLAIRSFKDIYREGENPYIKVYLPVGLVDGTNLDDGTVFSFKDEELRGINIITLADDKGNNILVPDNFILSYPSETGINYREFYLSCSLGPLPDTIDLTVVKDTVKEAVQGVLGVIVTVNDHSIPTTTSPTYEEHLALSQARVAMIEANRSGYVNKINELSSEVAALRVVNDTLTQILKDNNLLNGNVIIED